MGVLQSMMPKSGNHFSDNIMLNIFESIRFMTLDRLDPKSS